MIIFSIICLLIVACGNYYCLNRYGFKQEIIFNIVFLFIVAVIEAIFFNNGSFLSVIIQPIYEGLISAFVCDFVFEKSRSIISYFAILIAIIVAVTILPAWIIAKSAQMVS